MSTSFLKHFNLITDTRIEHCTKHELIDILLLTISAALSGAQGWEDIEDFGHLKLNWLKIYEITAISELLTMLDIENSIITLDAMGCQQEIAKPIIKQKANYILALKENHSGLQGELEASWHENEREGLTKSNYDKHTEIINSGHARIETRACEQLIINKSY